MYKCLLKNGTFSKNCRFSLNYRATIFSINFLKVKRSIAQKDDLTLHLTEADRGALYNKANSPNESPFYNYFLTSPLIIISTTPESNCNNKIKFIYCNSNFKIILMWKYLIPITKKQLASCPY